MTLSSISQEFLFTVGIHSAPYVSISSSCTTYINLEIEELGALCVSNLLNTLTPQRGFPSIIQFIIIWQKSRIRPIWKKGILPISSSPINFYLDNFKEFKRKLINSKILKKLILSLAYLSACSMETELNISIVNHTE